MNIKNISFTQIKQQFSDSAQKIGSFCGRKVEVLKARSSETYHEMHTRVAAFAQYSFTKMSSAWNSITTGFKAAKQFVAAQLSQICSKISEAASKIFKKKAQEQEAPAPAAPAAEEAPAPAPAAPAAEEAPAPAAPAADVSQRGRVRRKTVRFGFDN